MTKLIAILCQRCQQRTSLESPSTTKQHLNLLLITYVIFSASIYMPLIYQTAVRMADTPTTHAQAADATEPENLRRRSTRYYFPTGDVVLCVSATRSRGTDTQRLEEEYFRVDKALLSKHSRVFEDMFTFPPAPDGADMYDGVPLVHLVGDDFVAVEHLLDFMYDPSSVIIVISFQSRINFLHS